MLQNAWKCESCFCSLKHSRLFSWLCSCCRSHPQQAHHPGKRHSCFSWVACECWDCASMCCDESLPSWFWNISQFEKENVISINCIVQKEHLNCAGLEGASITEKCYKLSWHFHQERSMLNQFQAKFPAGGTPLTCCSSSSFRNSWLRVTWQACNWIAPY